MTTMLRKPSTSYPPILAQPRDNSGRFDVADDAIRTAVCEQCFPRWPFNRQADTAVLDCTEWWEDIPDGLEFEFSRQEFLVFRDVEVVCVGISVRRDGVWATYQII